MEKYGIAFVDFENKDITYVKCDWATFLFFLEEKETTMNHSPWNDDGELKRKYTEISQKDFLKFENKTIVILKGYTE